MSTPEDRLQERLDLEEHILRRAFRTARIERATNTVIVTDHHLPPGWSHQTSDVLFGFPATYPAGCPDNVCVRPDLRLASGDLPGNNQGVQTIAGRTWLQMSWHIDAADWSPTADPRHGSNLTSYLIGALTRFEEAS